MMNEKEVRPDGRTSFFYACPATLLSFFLLPALPRTRPAPVQNRVRSYI